MIGKRTFFEYTADESYGTLERVLKNGLAPVLAVPDAVREIKKVLVAYDNSVPASKVVHMFLLLGILEPLVILHCLRLMMMLKPDKSY